MPLYRTFWNSWRDPCSIYTIYSSRGLSLCCIHEKIKQKSAKDPWTTQPLYSIKSLSSAKNPKISIKFHKGRFQHLNPKKSIVIHLVWSRQDHHCHPQEQMAPSFHPQLAQWAVYFSFRKKGTLSQVNTLKRPHLLFVNYFLSFHLNIPRNKIGKDSDLC